MADFTDRLDATAYEDASNPDGVWIDGGLEDAVWLPEVVLERLTGLGRGYRLHYLGSVLQYHTENRLNPMQSGSLSAELRFVQTLTNDPVLARYLPSLIAQIDAASRQTADLIVDMQS